MWQRRLPPHQLLAQRVKQPGVGCRCAAREEAVRVVCDELQLLVWRRAVLPPQQRRLGARKLGLWKGHHDNQVVLQGVDMWRMDEQLQGQHS